VGGETHSFLITTWSNSGGETHKSGLKRKFRVMSGAHKFERADLELELAGTVPANKGILFFFGVIVKPRGERSLDQPIFSTTHPRKGNCHQFSFALTVPVITSRFHIWQGM
jgi:hypothetical protein